jgi:hypothetical protein
MAPFIAIITSKSSLLSYYTISSMNEGYLCPYLSDATINDTLCCCYYSVELNLTQVRGPLNIHAEFVKKLLKIWVKELLLVMIAINGAIKKHVIYKCLDILGSLMLP